MKYLAVLGRQPEISLAELEALFSNVQQISHNLASFDEPIHSSNTGATPRIDRLGGTLKLAVKLTTKPLDFFQSLPDGKITLGVSDYSKNASTKSATLEALKLKKILTRHGRSVRVVENKAATLSTATSLYNGLSGKNARKVELIKSNHDWYRVIGVQDIDAYAKRDQARPARDARVGMLPPKLAQILINLCGPLPSNARILDPFCGTGVVLQEALLMGYQAYGTDINERMVEYSERNLEWLINTKNANTEKYKGEISDHQKGGGKKPDSGIFQIAKGDATSFVWSLPIDAVACECYLGKPFTSPPTTIELKTEKQTCQTVILNFLKNLADQISSGTPITIAIPAWLRADGTYDRLEILAFLDKLGYNVNNKSREGLIYCRKEQIVARDIIILRKN